MPWSATSKWLAGLAIGMIAIASGLWATAAACRFFSLGAARVSVHSGAGAFVSCQGGRRHEHVVGRGGLLRPGPDPMGRLTD